MYIPPFYNNGYYGAYYPSLPPPSTQTPPVMPSQPPMEHMGERGLTLPRPPPQYYRRNDNGKMSFMGIGQGISLKELLENPKLQNPPDLNRDTLKDKLKGSGSYEPDYTSAFLGPNLWGNQMYEDESLKLEYMDLDEFLSENGIPLNLEDNAQLNNDTLPNKSPMQPRDIVPAAPNSPPNLATVNPHEILPEQCAEISECEQEEEEATETLDEVSVGPQPQVSTANIPDNKSINAPSLLEGVKVERFPSVGFHDMKVEFEVNEADVALATIPGQEGFNPKERKFSDEELKPQPIIKKSRKVFIPEDLKDDRYWSRRKKNNIAAKRSRDARRVKENQIAMRAAFLEKENESMKAELMKLKVENNSLKLALSKYEGTS